MKFKHNWHLLREIIAAVAAKSHEQSFCLYSDKGELDLDARYFVSDYPKIDDDDKEIYPSDVASGLWLEYYGDGFEDVIYLALEQKPTASPQEILAALKYYSERDDFLDLK